MSKTIKQIANELGVSKQAVTKCIDNLGLRSTLTKNGNFFVVGDSQEKAIKSVFSSHQTANHNANHNANQTPTNLADIIKVLQATIDTLQGQLVAKDGQIAALQAELDRERQHSREQSDKFSVLADQAQQLQAASVAKEQMLIEDKQVPKKHWWQRRKNQE